MIPGSKGQKADASLLARGFLNSIENLQKYSGEGMLTSVYVYAVSLSICAILMMVIKEKTQEMDL